MQAKNMSAEYRGWMDAADRYESEARRFGLSEKQREALMALAQRARFSAAMSAAAAGRQNARRAA